MNTVISKLLTFLFCTYRKDVNYELAYYILNHLEEKLTLNDLVQECHTSVPTANKFFEMLGYQSFSMFQKELTATMEIRKSQIRQRYEDIDEDRLLSMMEAEAVLDFDRNEMLEKADDIVSRINSHDRIRILASVFPLALTLSFAEDLFLFGKPVLYEAVEETYLDQEAFYIIVSYTGRYMIQHRAAFEMLERKIPDYCLITKQSYGGVKKKAVTVPLPYEKDDVAINSFVLNFFYLVSLRYYRSYSERN